MAMFTSARDVSLLRHLNRELMGNIITQQCAIYQFKLEETKVNLYGEAAEEKYYNGPFLFNVLINRNDQSYPGGNFELITQEQNIDFFFLRDDLVKADVVPEVGDIILYQESYYGVQSTNNDYDGTPNPLNPGLENFGESVSILASTYYIPSDKVSISPYKERF
jgi:hypothetical protein